MADEAGRRWRSAFDPRRNLHALLVRPRGHLAHVDGLRALSILVVVIFHLFLVAFLAASRRGEPLPVELHDPIYINWVWRGEYGVDVFFAISGYLIARHLFRQNDRNRLSLRRFYWRRFMRIYPVFGFCVAAYAVLGGEHVEELWANLLFVNNLRPWADTGMEWTWSLAIEEQFYLLFPLFLLLIFVRVRQRLLLLCVLGLVSVAVRAYLACEGSFSYPLPFIDDAGAAYMHDYLDTLYTKPYARMAPIVTGIIAAYLHHAHWDRVTALVARRPVLVTASYAGLVMPALWLWVAVPNYQLVATHATSVAGTLWLIFGRALIGATAAATILLGCTERHVIARAIQRVLGLRLWYPVAQLSYSTYLIHLFVAYGYFLAAPNRLTIGTVLEAFPVIIAITFGISTILYLALERPLMNLR